MWLHLTLFPTSKTQLLLLHALQDSTLRGPALDRCAHLSNVANLLILGFLVHNSDNEAYPVGSLIGLGNGIQLTAP